MKIEKERNALEIINTFFKLYLDNNLPI